MAIDELKGIIKLGLKDKVDTLIILSLIVASVVDMFTDVILTGGYSFYLFYVLFLWYRMNFFKKYYLKDKFIHELPPPDSYNPDY